MSTTVAHIKDADLSDPSVVYIGRKMLSRNLFSIWGNPFKIGKDGTRDQVIAKYRTWLLESTPLMDRIGDLRGKTLVCWCSPAACHGDVLAELADANAPA